MAQLERDPVFSALTRPQMFAGVTYNWFILNAIVTAEIFLVTDALMRSIILVANYVTNWSK